jgi:hypothetical protein
MSPEEILNGPHQMHFYIDSDGRRQSSYLQKDCRTFQALRSLQNTQAEAVSRGYAQGPRSEVHVLLPPPPPTITNGNQRQLHYRSPKH